MNANQSKPLRILVLDESAVEADKTSRILQSIRECEIEILDSVHDTLQSIGKQVPDLIVSDLELKDHTAEELLRVMATYQKLRNIPVLIATIFQSKKQLNRLMELGAIGVLCKPVEKNVLEQHLEKLVPTESDDQVNMAQAAKSIQEHLKQIRDLAPLPTLVSDIISISNNPRSTARDLASVIQKDQAISARLLRIVNSAYYNFYRKISDVSRSVVILGLLEVKNISLAACLMQNYPVRKSPDFNPEMYWKHALGTAYISRELSKLCKDLTPEDAFTMGLLHDFGKVIFDQHFGAVFDVILREAKQDKQPLHKAENQLVGIDHSVIGSLIADNWNLPEPLVRSIRYHHEPYLSFSDNRVSLVHLANHLCHKRGIGASGNPVPDELHPGTLPSLGLEDKDLDDVWEMTGIDAEAMGHIL